MAKTNNTRVTVNINTASISKRMQSYKKQGRRVLKNEIVKDVEPSVPIKTGALRRSAYASINKDDNQIVYAKIYARFLKMGKVMVGINSRSSWARRYEKKVVTNKNLTYSQGGSHWFSKTKNMKLQKWVTVYKKVFRK